MGTLPGLRERKKQLTKETLLRSAYYLFNKNGYNETSIEDIAAHANFAPRTFFLHFSSKEDLLFPRSEALLQRMVDILDSRGEMPALAAFKKWQIEELAPLLVGHEEHEALRHRLIPENRQLQARVQSYVSKMQHLLANAIAKDRGLSSPDLTSNIAATAAVSVLSNLYQNGMEHVSQQEITKSIREALELLGDA